jgi:hypothetical protein
MSAIIQRTHIFIVLRKKITSLSLAKIFAKRKEISGLRIAQLNLEKKT